MHSRVAMEVTIAVESDLLFRALGVLLKRRSPVHRGGGATTKSFGHFPNLGIGKSLLDVNKCCHDGERRSNKASPIQKFGCQQASPSLEEGDKFVVASFSCVVQCRITVLQSKHAQRAVKGTSEKDN
jgi:hypothetical protein